MALLSVCALAALASLVSASTSDKRGLDFIPNSKWPQDNQIWVQPGSDLTWYYNYGSEPSSEFSGVSQSDFEFVPMMWGASSNLSDTTFLTQIQALIKSGTNVTHIMSFNEPNENSDVGGSQLDPKDAAQAWVANFEPLANQGIKLGLPACSGAPSGLPWLENFLDECSKLVSTSGDQKNCTWDFLPVHWYDNFAGLASLIGQRVAEWPGKEIWVTEYAFANQDLDTTELFFNQTIDYFDKEDYIQRYSYFGAFRSKVSNVGPDVVFLNNKGKLTNIGSLYLGFGETGVTPDSGATSSTSPRSTAGLVAALAAALFLVVF